MAKDFSKILNVASDFYNGAVKGAKKATYTVNKVTTKNNMAKNLNVSKTINKSKNIASNLKKTTPPNTKVGIKTNSIPRKVANQKQVTIKPNAAQSAGNWAGGGIRESIKSYKKMGDNEKSIIGAIKDGHKNADKTGYDMGKIAGTAFTVGVAGRIASGGGLYKDRYGNTNLPGVPFI